MVPDGPCRVDLHGLRHVLLCVTAVAVALTIRADLSARSFSTAAQYEARAQHAAAAAFAFAFAGWSPTSTVAGRGAMTHIPTNKALAALGALGTSVALLLSGCSSAPPKTPSATSQPPALTQTQPATSPSSTATTMPESLPFGVQVTFSDDVAVTVSKPVPTAPQQGGPPGMTKWFKFTVTIHNGGTAAYDPSLLTTSMLTGETEATQTMDLNDPNLGLPPTTKVLPGHTIKVPYLYAGTPGAITVQVNLGVGYDDAIWHE